MARVQGMTPEGIRKAIAEAISFIEDLNVEDLNKLLAAFEDANGIFDVRLVEAQEEVKKAGDKALEAEEQARLIVEELARHQELQEAESARILSEVAAAIQAANLASNRIPELLQRLAAAEEGLTFANSEFSSLIIKQDEFLDTVIEQTSEVSRLNSEFAAVNQVVDEAVDKVDQSVVQVNQIGGDLELARAVLDAKIKQSQEDISAARKVADEHQNEIETLVGDLGNLSTKHETLTTNFSAEVGKLEAADASLLTNMNTKVGDLNAITSAQSTAISAAKAQADKGVSDAAAASNALSSYKKVNDPKVLAAQSTADTARSEAVSKANAARIAAEGVAKELADKAQADAEVAAAAEALRVAQAEATAAKNAAAADATAKANAAQSAAETLAKAQAKAAQEAAELTAAQDAATKAENARIAAEANAKVLSDKAQQAAVAAQSSIDNLEIGGRNLFRTSMYSHHTNVAYNPTVGTSAVVEIEPNTEYTVSIRNKQTNRFGIWQDPLPNGIHAARESNDNSIFRFGYIPTTPGEDLVYTFTTLGEEAGRYITIYLSNEGGDQHMDKIKVERGNRATDWSPAPEDIDESVAKAQAEAELARAEATSKANAARIAAEDYAKEKSEADVAASLVTSAAEALRVAKLQADEAKAAAATDAKAKADEAERLAKVYAAAQAKSAKETAEANAALDATNKANKAKDDAEANAKLLSDKAQQAAEAAQSSIDNLEIGGRNLIGESNSFSRYGTIYGAVRNEIEEGVTVPEWGATDATRMKYTRGTSSLVTTPQISYNRGETVTFSYWFKNVGTTTIRVRYNGLSPYGKDSYEPGFSGRVVHTGKLRSDYDWFQHQIYVDNPDDSNIEFILWRSKLERGTKATDWTPAPEDIDASVAKAQAEAETARAEATSKANAARDAAEKTAKELADQAQADAEVEAARVALEIAQREANAAQEAAADDATTKANNARTAAENLARAEANAARETAEANAAIEAQKKANKAKEDAEATADTLATAAKNAAATALNTYKGLNDPKVTKAQTDANTGISKADAAKKQADKGVTDAATALAKANEANSKLPAITSDVADAARVAAEAVNALPGIRTDISTAKQQADKGVQDAATAKSAVDNLEIGGRNLLLGSAMPNRNGVAPGITTEMTPEGLKIVANPVNDNYVSFLRSVVGPSPAGDTLKDGDQVTFSLEIKSEDSTHVPAFYAKPSMTYRQMIGEAGPKFTRVYVTRPWAESGVWNMHLGFQGRPGTYIIRNFKLERGTRATDWTPAPEEVDAGITTAQSTADTARSEAESKANQAKKDAEETAQQLANDAKTAAEGTALTLSNQALQDATTALTNYQKVNDPKVTAAQSTATTAKSAADVAKQRADKGVADAADAKSAVDNLEIGGRNLITNSNDFSNYVTSYAKETETGISVPEWGATDATRLKYVKGSSTYLATPVIPAQIGETHTFSFWIKNIGNTNVITRWNGFNPAGDTVIPPGFQGRISHTAVMRTSHTWFQHQFTIEGLTGSAGAGTEAEIIVWRIQLERGNKTTDWSPAPEDVDAEITAAQSTADTARSEADAAKKRADKGVADAATAKSAADNAREEADRANDLLKVKDTRNTDELPHYYWVNYSRTTATEFKSSTSLGLSGGYGTLTTVVPWHDSSGGSIHQTFVVNNGGATYKRRSRGSGTNATWGEWVNELAELNSQIGALVTRADTLTTGLSNAATQEQYNQLNIELWGDQGSINKLQGEINANNEEFQNWQREINDQQGKWNEASENATLALGRFAISQSEWNVLSATATDANTKALQGLTATSMLTFPHLNVVPHDSSDRPWWSIGMGVNTTLTPPGFPSGPSYYTASSSISNVNPEALITVVPGLDYKLEFWAARVDAGTAGAYTDVRDEFGNVALTHWADVTDGVPTEISWSARNYAGTGLGTSTAWVRKVYLLRVRPGTEKMALHFRPGNTATSNGTRVRFWGAHLSAFMPIQEQIDATQNAALASHAALFEGQNKWNEVATSAIQAQATLLEKQDRWSDGVNKALAWQDQLNDTQSDINKTTKSVLANQAKWNSAQALVNDSQSDINKATQAVLLNQSKWNTAQEKVNNDQSELNKAVKAVQDKQEDWNDSVTKALAAHTELFVSTSTTFKSVKAVQDNQTKWNKVVGDLVTTNTNVSAANKTAIEGLNRVLGIKQNTTNVVPEIPGGVRTGGTDIAPVFTPMAAWLEKCKRATIADIPGVLSTLGASESTVVNRTTSPDYKTVVDPNVEYKFSYWVKASVANRSMRIVVRHQDGTDVVTGVAYVGDQTGATYTSATSILSWISKVPTVWTQYTGTFKFKPHVREFYISQIQFNYNAGSVTPANIQLADLQIYPNMPSQADVNKALTDSDAAQNTLLAKQESWNDAASRSIATMESLWGKTTEEVGVLNTMTDELGEKITQQGDDFAKNISQLFNFIPRIAYAEDGQNVPSSETDGFIKITRTISNSQTTHAAVEAVGNWVGSIIIEGDHGRSGGKDQTFLNYTPIRVKRDVNTGTRIFNLWRNTSVDHIGAIKVTFFVDPGEVRAVYPSGTNVYPDRGLPWKVLTSDPAPETSDYNISLNVTWAATTYGDNYGIQIRVGDTIVAKILKDKVGPLFPGESGVRTMSLNKSQVRVKEGEVISLEAYSYAPNSTQRRISKWHGQISYITSGRG